MASSICLELDDPRQERADHGTDWYYVVYGYKLRRPPLSHYPHTGEDIHYSFHAHVAYHIYRIEQGLDSDDSRIISGMIRSHEGMNEMQVTALVSSLWNGDRDPVISQVWFPRHTIQSVRMSEHVYEIGSFEIAGRRILVDV